MSILSANSTSKERILDQGKERRMELGRSLTEVEGTRLRTENSTS